MGAVLSQSSAEHNKLHPCAFLSWKLSPAERNYDVANRELLAVKVALEELVGGHIATVSCLNRPQEPGVLLKGSTHNRQGRLFSLINSISFCLIVLDPEISHWISSQVFLPPKATPVSFSGGQIVKNGSLYTFGQATLSQRAKVRSGTAVCLQVLEGLLCSYRCHCQLAF